MLNHISIGVRDFSAARRFYETVLKPLGYGCVYEAEGIAGFGADRPEFWIGPTDSPVPPDPRSGLHICFTAPTRNSVDAFHRAALGAGATDNGPPGLRPEYGPDYYAAFVVDPDGYRIEAYCALPES